MQNPGVLEKLRQRSGTIFQGGRQHINVELESVHSPFYSAGSPTAPSGREAQLFAVNVRLSQGFLNKWIFCAAV